MFPESDLLTISALQHLAFCERQWGLMYLEGIWEENPLTVSGRHLHERIDQPGTESRGDLRIAHGLRLHSLRLGLVGIADVVEFHRVGADDASPRPGAGAPEGVALDGVPGCWRLVPVEYKRGRPKKGPCDRIQLCSQVLCLEEMLAVTINAGVLFYGRTRRRYDVPFDTALRAETETLTVRLHELTRSGRTPTGRYEKKCRSCSLFSQCLPKATTGRSAASYLARAIDTVCGDSEVADSIGGE